MILCCRATVFTMGRSRAWRGPVWQSAPVQDLGKGSRFGQRGICIARVLRTFDVFLYQPYLQLRLYPQPLNGTPNHSIVSSSTIVQHVTFTRKVHTPTNQHLSTCDFVRRRWSLCFWAYKEKNV